MTKTCLPSISARRISSGCDQRCPAVTNTVSGSETASWRTTRSATSFHFTSSRVAPLAKPAMSSTSRVNTSGVSTVSRMALIRSVYAERPTLARSRFNARRSLASTLVTLYENSRPSSSATRTPRT